MKILILYLRCQKIPSAEKESPNNKSRLVSSGFTNKVRKAKKHIAENQAAKPSRPFIYQGLGVLSRLSNEENFCLSIDCPPCSKCAINSCRVFRVGKFMNAHSNSNESVVTTLPQPLLLLIPLWQR